MPDSCNKIIMNFTIRFCITIHFLLFFFLGICTNNFANPRQTILTVKISDPAERDVIRLSVFDKVFGADGNAFSDNRSILACDTIVDITDVSSKTGVFKFAISNLSVPRYALLYSKNQQSRKIKVIDLHLLLYPGDSVTINEKNGEFSFSGIGFQKYECSGLIERTKKLAGSPEGRSQIVQWFNKLDSLADICKSILDGYKMISHDIRKVISSNIFCDFEEMKYNYLNFNGFPGDGSQYSKYQPILAGYSSRNSAEINDIVCTKDSVILHSLHFLLFLIDNYKLDCYISGREYTTVECFHFLVQNYTGSVRQSLIYFLFNKDVYDHKYDLAKCIKVALDSNYLNDPNLKRYMSEFVNNNSDSAKAFSFSFMDNNDRFISLDDFASTVVLLDFWYVGCGPCVNMHRILDSLREKIDNRAFKIVSICIDDGTSGREKWKEAIKSGKYTSVCNINLYSPGSNHKYDEIVNYYHIVGCPSLILIDKAGRVSGKYLDPRLDHGISLVRDIYNLL